MQCPIQVLREFIEDVIAAHGEGSGDPIRASENLSEEWPDLAGTFDRAIRAIDEVDNLAAIG
jgi:hypothetical protein